MKSNLENKNNIQSLVKLNTNEKTRPLVFEKKKSSSRIKMLKYMDVDLGKVRHYPTASQEWYNSIYTYNKNYLKSLPTLDKTLTILLEKYCNMWPEEDKFKKSPKLISKEIKDKNLIGKRKYWLKRRNQVRPIKFLSRNRLTPKKVFVGRGDLKHTSDKVIVTLYTYDVSKIHLLKKMRKLIYSKFFTEKPLVKITTKVKIKNEYNNSDLWSKMTSNKKGKSFSSAFIKVANKNFTNIKKVLLFNRRLTLDEYLSSSYNYMSTYINNPYTRISKKDPLSKLLPANFIKKVEKVSKRNHSIDLVSSYSNLISYSILKVDKFTNQLKTIIKYYKYLTSLVEKKIINSNEKLLLFINKVSKLNIYKYRNKPRFIMTKFKEKRLYLALLLRFAWLIYGHDSKFKNPIMVSKLKYMISNLYDKEVEFNVVQLKKMHLSSDIYTQMIATKLKNRKNRIYKVLKWSVRKINLPNVSRQLEKYSHFDKQRYLPNLVRNSYINSMFNIKFSNNNMDYLNNLLLNLFPTIKNKSEEIKDNVNTSKSYSLEKYLVNNIIKHNKLAGIRVEARGRLTRRLTAQRSLFKMRYTGGLKTVDSSFKGLAAVMLRGYLKNNIQYSVIQSKNKNGAYGIKGWVGYK
jgi:hypothetical protein